MKTKYACYSLMDKVNSNFKCKNEKEPKFLTELDQNMHRVRSKLISSAVKTYLEPGIKKPRRLSKDTSNGRNMHRGR